jgi:multidrug efflux pump subunit AcrB
LLLVPFLGRDFFPSVDSGQMAMHVRAPVGTQIEETSDLFARVQKKVRELLPAGEIGSIVDNIGLSTAPLNNIYANSGTVGPNEGDVLIALAHGHAPTADHVALLRRELPRAFPGVDFAFLPADMTSQILNFGSPAPIDIQIKGRQLPENMAYAKKLVKRLRTIPGLADVRIQQSARYPQLNVDVDRSQMAQYGMNQRNVTSDLGIALAGTQQSSPIFYLNPENGVSYPVVAQIPERSVGSVADLANIPVSGARDGSQQTLGGLGTISRGATMSVVSKYNIAPVINIFASTQNRDLGAVAADVQTAIASLDGELAKGATVTLSGQYGTMNTAFSGLGFGLVGAIILIYLVIVVNFQSWVDPLVIIGALPAALAGIVWMLFVTGTTVSVPALTGAIMCMGVATANAILVVSFARERLAETGDAVKAALEAGVVRLRPVLMTALAMILGMAPMAIGLGEGAEQNAPLGRAVIGGLIFATAATLFLVPVLFSIAHRARAPKSSSGELALHHA